jgi:iron complex transport system substrate-binding protein
VKRLLALGATLLLVPFLLVACGSDNDNNGSTSGSTGPAPTATTTAAIDLSKDDLGRSVTVPKNPQRVVALSPTAVELMYAVGATPVGRPSSANYPEAAKSVPDFGSSYQPSFEEIVAMKPDLIIADAIIHQGMINDLATLNVPIWAVKVDSFQTVVSGLQKVGALTGHQDQGNAEAKKLTDKMAAVKAKLPAQKPSVLIVVAAGPGQFIASKDTSYLGSLVTELGATNVVKTDPDNFRFPGFADYSVEKIIAADPDIVIGISVGGPPGTPKTTDLLAQTPGWSSLKAVKNGNVKEVDPVIYLESAGPRVSQILDELPRILYPNVFASR